MSTGPTGRPPANASALPFQALAPADLARMVGESAALDRQIALHANATPEVLSRLSRSADRITRRNVTLNPQTPKEILLKLAPTFPSEFFLNPVFDLLLLEDPDMLNDLPVGVFKHILKRPDCPRSFLDWAGRQGSASLQLAVAGREDTPVEVLERIAADRHVKAAELAMSRLMADR